MWGLEEGICPKLHSELVAELGRNFPYVVNTLGRTCLREEQML